MSAGEMARTARIPGMTCVAVLAREVWTARQPGLACERGLACLARCACLAHCACGGHFAHVAGVTCALGSA